MMVFYREKNLFSFLLYSEYIFEFVPDWPSFRSSLQGSHPRVFQTETFSILTICFSGFLFETDVHYEKSFNRKLKFLRSLHTEDIFEVYQPSIASWKITIVHRRHFTVLLFLRDPFKIFHTLKNLWRSPTTFSDILCL